MQTTERYVEPVAQQTGSQSQPPLSPAESAEEEDWLACPNCEGKFRAAAFDANDGYCPGCNRDEFGDERDDAEAAPKLSEAELLLEEIEDDDDHKMRVDRLPNYKIDGHTDTGALKEFCTTLCPPGRDYLDVVRRLFGGGDYWFTVYKKGRPGVVKAWHRSIAQPLTPVTEPAVVTQPAGANGLNQEVDRLRLAVEKAVARRIERILGDDDSQPNSTALSTQPPQTEESLLANAILSRPEIIESVIRRVNDKVVGGNEGEAWYVPLVREAAANIPTILTTLQTLAQQRAGAAPANTTEPTGAPPPQTSPAQSSQPARPSPSPAEVAYWRLIRRCAADMSSNIDAQENQVDETLAVEETIRLITTFPEYQTQLTRVLSVPPGMLVQFIAAQCQDPMLIQNPGAAVFAADYQNSLRSALEELAQQQTDKTVVEFPHAAEPPAPQSPTAEAAP